MKKLLVVAVAVAVLFAGTACLQDMVRKVEKSVKKEGLSEGTIIAGLKEALKTGTHKAVMRLSQAGGYGNDPQLRIPLPEDLKELADKLKKVGLEDEVKKFISRMNSAAELAAKEAVPVFVDAVKQMSIQDAKQIWKGNATAATDYFKAKTAGALRRAYMPIVRKAMEQVGAVKNYNDLVRKYNAIPFVKKVESSVEGYVTDEALTGLYAVIAVIETEIRTNAAARTTELLKKVFGRQ
jgi:hypothetical protein